MLRFKSMEFSNFLSFEGDHSFEFAQTGIHLVTGVNLDVESDSSYTGRHSVGSGKSTFTVLPQFALFGDIAKNINKDQIINKKAKKDLKVILYFSVNDIDYRVERYRKHKQNKNGLFLFEFIGGQWVDQTQSDAAATQRELDKIILINQETFLKTVLLSREDLQQFLDYNPADRWKIFESIIQLDKLKKYQDLITKKKKDSVVEFNKIKSDITAANAIYNHSVKQLEDFKKAHAIKSLKLHGEIAELNKQFQSITEEGSIDNLVKKIYELDALTTAISLKNDSLTSSNLELKKIKIAMNRNDVAMVACKDQVESLQEQVTRVQKVECHECGAIQNQDSYDLHIKQILQSIKYQTELMDEKKEESKNLIERFVEVSDFIKITQEEIDFIEKELNDFPLDQNFKELITEMDSKAINELIFEIRELDHRIIFKNNELKEAQDTTALDKIEADILKMEKDLKKKNKEKDVIEKTVNELSYLDDILDIRKENSIKQYAVSSIMPVFNELMRQNLDQTFDDQLTLVLDLLFKETIYFNREPYDYNELSTGERVKLNLSINFAIFDAMRLNVMNTGVMFLDEIFSYIDEPSIASFVAMIKNKYTTETAIYVITHQSEVVDKIDACSVTTITKENGSSNLSHVAINM